MLAVVNITACTFLGDSRALLSDINCPAFENTRSLGTDVATMQKLRSANLERRGYTITRANHQASGLSRRPMNGSSMFFRTWRIASVCEVVWETAWTVTVLLSKSPHIRFSTSLSTLTTWQTAAVLSATAISVLLYDLYKSKADWKSWKTFLHKITKDKIIAGMQTIISSGTLHFINRCHMIQWKLNCTIEYLFKTLKFKLHEFDTKSFHLKLLTLMSLIRNFFLNSSLIWW